MSGMSRAASKLKSKIASPAIPDVAVCIGTTDDNKQAALFFDHIVPLGSLFSNIGLFAEDRGEGAVPDQVLHPKIRQLRHNRDDKDGLLTTFGVIVLHAQQRGRTLDVRNPHDHFWDLYGADPGCRKCTEIFLKRVGVLGAPIVARQPSSQIESALPALPDGSGNPLVSLTNLKMIDTSQTDWREILEFRKDEKSVKQLRALKSFLRSNSILSAPPQQVREEMERALEKYMKVLEDKRFYTQQGVLQKVFGREGLIAGTVGAGSALVAQSAEIGALGALLGLSTVMGGIAVNIRETNRKYDELLNGSEAAFLVSATARFDRRKWFQFWKT